MRRGQLWEVRLRKAGPPAKQVIVTAFDPLKGRGSELTRFDLNPSTSFWAADLSPDGARVAAITNPAGPILLLSLRGLPHQELRVKGWSDLRSVDWASDGEGLFISNSVQGGAVLLHADLKGNVHVLWKTQGGSRIPVRSSPDGHHLAIQGWTVEGNLWMMKNF